MLHWTTPDVPMSRLSGGKFASRRATTHDGRKITVYHSSSWTNAYWRIHEEYTTADGITVSAWYERWGTRDAAMEWAEGHWPNTHPAAD